jgi:hypothetical protein
LEYLIGALYVLGKAQMTLSLIKGGGGGRKEVTGNWRKL